jgi:hypothetical protein
MLKENNVLSQKKTIDTFKGKVILKIVTYLRLRYNFYLLYNNVKYTTTIYYKSILYIIDTC